MLPDLKNGTLHKSQYPKIKTHKKTANTFTLTFDIQKNKLITSRPKLVPVAKTQLNSNPQRILIIDKCADCKFCIHDDFSIMERRGKYWCDLLDIQLKRTGTIPAKCPLPIK